MMGKKTVYIGIGIFMTLTIILVVLIGGFREERVSHNGGEALSRTPDLQEGTRVVQEFIPQFDYLRSISIDLDLKGNSVSEGNLHFSLRNMEGKLLCSREYPLSEFTDGGFFRIPVKRAVRVGDIYQWEVFVTEPGDAAPALYCTAPGVVSPSENVKMTVGGETCDNTAVTMYVYGARQGKVALLNDITFLLWFCVAAAGFFTKYYLDNKKVSK